MGPLNVRLQIFPRRNLAHLIMQAAALKDDTQLRVVGREFLQMAHQRRRPVPGPFRSGKLVGL